MLFIKDFKCVWMVRADIASKGHVFRTIANFQMGLLCNDFTIRFQPLLKIKKILSHKELTSPTIYVPACLPACLPANLSL